MWGTWRPNTGHSLLAASWLAVMLRLPILHHVEITILHHDWLSCGAYQSSIMFRSPILHHGCHDEVTNPPSCWDHHSSIIIGCHAEVTNPPSWWDHQSSIMIGCHVEVTNPQSWLYHQSSNVEIPNPLSWLGVILWLCNLHQDCLLCLGNSSSIITTDHAEIINRPGVAGAVL